MASPGGGNRRCDDCTFWATDFQWQRLAEYRAKAAALDRLTKAAEEAKETHGHLDDWAWDSDVEDYLAEEREKGGLSPVNVLTTLARAATNEGQ